MRKLTLCLTLVLSFFVLAAAAQAATRYASPDGTPADDCSLADPCDLLTATDPSQLDDGDDVSVASGEYSLSDTIPVIDDILLAGESSSDKPVITSDAPVAIQVSNAGADVADLEIRASSDGIQVSEGDDLARLIVVAESAGATACDLVGFDGVIRDSVCAGDETGAHLGDTSSAEARNLTATAVGPDGIGPNHAIFVTATTIPTQVDVINTIARGPLDIEATGADITTQATVDAAHSNFDLTSVNSDGVVNETNTQTEPPELDATYHQLPSSPTIDAGVFTISATDFEGDNRLQGSGTDIGADEIDNVEPETTLDSTSTTPGSDSTPTFEFSSEPGATFECAIDGGDFEACSSPHTTEELGDGEHSFYVRATDTAGNTDSTPAEFQFEIDTTPPETVIDSGPSGPTGDDTPTFEFSSPDPAATFECAIDGGAFEACSSPFTAEELSDGPHTFEVRAIDELGNQDPTPAQSEFSVDTVFPETSLDSAPSGVSSDNTPTFEFSSPDPSATFECSLNGEPFAPCESPLTTAALDDGEYTFEVRAIDPAGNQDQTPAQADFSIDTEGPETTIDSSPESLSSDPTPVFEFSSPDPAATFECSIDGSTFEPCESPHTTPALEDGPHTFEVRAVDELGNPDPTPASADFTIDTEAPETTLTAFPLERTADPTPTFEFEATEPDSTFECQLDSGGWEPCESPLTTAPLAEGSHTFSVRATDPLGNTDASPDTYTFTVDLTAPTTQITQAPPASGTDPTPTFAFEASEASTFECQIDRGEWEPCESPYTVGSLPDGEHLFEVRARDLAGNEEAEPASAVFVTDTAAPDTVAPQINLTKKSPKSTRSKRATFRFSLSEAATVTCKLDRKPARRCDGAVTYKNLKVGQHRVVIRAEDAAGNSSQAVWTWKVKQKPKKNKKR